MDFFEDLPIYVKYGSVGPGVKSSQNQGNSCIPRWKKMQKLETFKFI